MSALLSACQRPGDTQPPLIGITQPKSGVLSQKALRVEGYALDDTGVRSVRAMGQELLTAQTRGQKLARFSFKVQAPSSGQFEVKVEATDNQGQARTVRLKLVLDARPPAIRLERAERVFTEVRPAQTRRNADGTTEEVPAQTEATLQISGKVLDDTGVDRVTVQYDNTFLPLSLPKGQEVSFYVELPVRRATIIAVDSAGNRTTQVVSR
ncbi:MAG: hypothetical protein SFU83_11745 [Meiothermus sp.]|nr:hypothetical protein [Meiothermus sp.]